MTQDGIGFVQVPSTWRPLIEDSSTLQLLLDFYRSSSPPLSSAALECLVRTSAAAMLKSVPT